jgi:hypothetical protein
VTKISYSSDKISKWKSVKRPSVRCSTYMAICTRE